MRLPRHCVPRNDTDARLPRCARNGTSVFNIIPKNATELLSIKTCPLFCPLFFFINHFFVFLSRLVLFPCSPDFHSHLFPS